MDHPGRLKVRMPKDVVVRVSKTYARISRGEHVGDKSHVAETAAGVHIRDIRDPPLIGALNLRPSPLNTNRETLRGGISNGGACGRASEYTRDSKGIHEALHLVTADGPACPVGGVP
ncbi:hypothetical protein CIP107582_01094 [Corynebacterium diphtheriae]|nr:hypothetical protein CIP107582_01094 [Corynebacterium diphtheriae]